MRIHSLCGRASPDGVNLHHGLSRSSTGLAVDMIAGIVTGIPCKIAGHGESTTVAARSFDNIPGVYALSEDCTFRNRRAYGHRLEENDSSNWKLHDWRKCTESLVKSGQEVQRVLYCILGLLEYGV